MASWKTTIVGILALATAISIGFSALLDSDPLTTINWETIIAALSGVGLLFARDNDVTSETAKAK